MSFIPPLCPLNVLAVLKKGSGGLDGFECWTTNVSHHPSALSPSVLHCRGAKLNTAQQPSPDTQLKTDCLLLIDCWPIFSFTDSMDYRRKRLFCSAWALPCFYFCPQFCGALELSIAFAPLDCSARCSTQRKEENPARSGGPCVVAYKQSKPEDAVQGRY